MSAPHIIIVGAGVIGLTCAIRLIERGATVTVLEGDDEEAPSASRAAAGMLGPLGESAEGSGVTLHPRATELALASFDLWRTRAEAFGVSPRFEGALMLGEDAHKVAAQALALDRAAQMMTSAAAHAEFGVRPTEGALFVRDEGVIDTPVALAALRARLRALGGEITFDVEAARVGRGDGPFAVDTDDIRRGADALVLAPGAWARQSLQTTLPALARISPAKGSLALARLPGDLRANIRGEGFYLAARNGRDAVLGATMEIDKSDLRDDPAGVSALFAAAEAALPGQVSRTDTPAWTGVRPMSPDWSPMIGPSGPRDCFVAVGHSRNGWLLAPVTAEIISAYVFGEDIPPLWAAFHPGRFETSS